MYHVAGHIDTMTDLDILAAKSCTIPPAQDLLSAIFLDPKDFESPKYQFESGCLIHRYRVPPRPQTIRYEDKEYNNKSSIYVSIWESARAGRDIPVP